MKLNTLFSLMALSLGSLTCFAAEPEEVPAITVVNSNGTETSVEKSQVSRIGLSSQTVQLMLSDGSVMEFDKKSIERIMLTGVAIDGLKDITAPTIKVYPRTFSDILNIEGGERGEKYTVFNLNGVPELRGRITGDVSQIETRGLKDGVYLLVVGKETFKIIKK